MTPALPDAVNAFFALGNGADAPPLSQCFTEHAQVRDEGGLHIGHRAIAEWMQDVREKYGFVSKPLTLAQDAAVLTVRAKVSGRFPGSPIELDYVFRMDADRIAELRIG